MSPAAATAALRSWLFVPGDSERKQARALATPADALILDLEDSVDAAQRPAARARVAALLGAPAAVRSAQLWVRVNAPSSGLMGEDLAAICAQALPAGVVLPKVSAPEEIIETARQLEALEAQRRGPRGAIRLLVLVTETPQGLLALPAYPAALARSPAALARLSGLTWGAEDLGAALGVLGRRDRGRLAHLHFSAGAQRLPARGGGAAATGHRHCVHRLSRCSRFSARAG